MQTGNYWDRLALIIASLVEKEKVANEEEFYKILDLDSRTIDAIRNREEELPNPSLQFLKEKFDVGMEYLKVGLGPMIYVKHQHDICLDEDLDVNDESGERRKYEDEEMDELLSETLELTKQDLRNKGHINEDEDE